MELKQQYTVKVPRIIYISIDCRFPQQHEKRDAADISFKGLQSVLQWPTLEKNKLNTLRKCLEISMAIQIG